MKIKCFNMTELPVLKWNDNCGASQEVFCWPVASDYSLRASIATIENDSFLKQYQEAERLVVLLDNHPVCLSDGSGLQTHLTQAGDSIRLPADQYVTVNISQPHTRVMNFIFRSDRWTAKSYLICDSQTLPISQAGVVFVLSGEWSVAGGNCKVMTAGQGGWWLPDIGVGEVKPLSTDSQLIWIEVLPI